MKSQLQPCVEVEPVEEISEHN